MTRRAQLALWLRHYAVFQSLAQLPLPLAYRYANQIGQRDCRHQSVARDYIANGMQHLLPATRESDVPNYFSMLAREVLDVFVMARLNPRRARQLLHLAPGSLKTLQDARSQGRGVIIAMSHYSRINMLLLSLALAGERLGMLTMVVDERNRNLDPVSRRYLQFKIGTLMHYIQGRWLTLGDDMRLLYRALEQGETMVMLLDAYTPERRQKKLSLPFLGGYLSVSRGLVRIAEKTGARIVYGVSYERDWAIEAFIRPLPDDPFEALQTAVDILEQDVLSTPWAWWHWNVWEAIWSPSA